MSLENLLLHIPPGPLYREYQSGSLGCRAPLSYDMLYTIVSECHHVEILRGTALYVCGRLTVGFGRIVLLDEIAIHVLQRQC